MNHLGYERVFVLGGYYEYKGPNLIEGIGVYDIGNDFYASYIDETTGFNYVIYGDYDVAKNIHELYLTIIEQYIDDTIYNFNELVDDLVEDGSDIRNLTNVDWIELSPIITLIETQYIE